MEGKIRQIGGLRDIKTLQTSKKRSIPRVQNPAYLDLYMLHKERDRLEKEIYVLDRKKKNIQKRLKEIISEMDKLERSEVSKRQASSEAHKKLEKKDWQAMPLKY